MEYNAVDSGRYVHTAKGLDALPLWSVLRTSRGMVVERNPQSGGSWIQMGGESSWIFDDEDFPCQVLWTAADG